MIETFHIRDIDTVFADFICKMENVDTDIIRKTAIFASASTGHGNICIELADIFESSEVDSVYALLLSANSIGVPGDYRPLILDERKRLYLYRYWKYETDLANELISMASDLPEIDIELLSGGLSRLFAKTPDIEDWQKIAAAAAVRSRFCVISGGPGTGKTTTVVKILALLLEQAKGERVRIALAAPTGKAAARLKESIFKAGKELENLTPVAVEIPSDVSTIQRLLGVIPNSCRFRYNAENKLPFEAVVIDEASMVPLGLMAKLVEALAPGTRLILLGDRDQLASVEAGAVLGDICNTGQSFGFSSGFNNFIKEVTGSTIFLNCSEERVPLMADSVIVLQKNYRFAEDSGIATVSRAINDGNAASVIENMKNGTAAGILLIETPSKDSLKKKLGKRAVEGFAEYLKQKKADDVLVAFDQFRVLCALRQGMYGVEGINSLIETCLGEEGVIKPDKLWYHGRPVMVTINDYSLKLFNGDIGITLDDPESEIGLSVYFPAVNGLARKYSPYRIPAHETVFAMTVHKSQGSEFEKVLLIMPPNDHKILTREIIYTGVTRARTLVELWCSDEIFRSSCEKIIQRRSGLRGALWD